MAALGDSNVSASHYRIRGRVQPIPEETVDILASAGAVWSTAEDMALWMRFVLDSARIGGRRLVSPDGYAMLFAPHAVIPADEFYPTATLTRPHWMTYGLGWFEQDYRGHFIAFHTGSLDGRTALIGLLPDAGLGVYVFGNLDHAELRHAIMLKVFDLFLGGAPRDWNADLLRLYGRSPARTDAEPASPAAANSEGEPATLPAARYVGRYLHPVWGEALVEQGGDSLRFRMGTNPQMRGPMVHVTAESFRLQLGDGRSPPLAARFALDSASQVTGLLIPDVDPVPFARIP
jgi:CubicO group peptidase (beta-lactamase class C family)